MEITDALEWATNRRTAVLITLRGDGRAQSSDIAYAVIGDQIRISVTHDRAKTRNIRRDGRVVVHITDPPSWSYASIDAPAEVSPVAGAPDDEVVDELVEVYRAVAGDHDDWDEVRRAMVADGRCVIRVTPRSVTGQIH